MVMIYNKENCINKVLNIVAEEGLHRGMAHYSLLIAPAPKPRIRTNGYNKYTPQGSMTVPNTNYRKELTAWKKNKLFPFFIEQGFTKEQLVDAYNKSIFK
jgi:hypothetical protein